MKMEKRYVTRQFYWGKNVTWNIWDKLECKWMTKLGYICREYALRDADEMNQVYYKKVF